MSELVGTGWVELVPEMRNFSKLVKAGLKKSLSGLKAEIPVTPVIDKKMFHDALAGPQRAIKVPVEVDRNLFARSLSAAVGDKKVEQHVRVSVDKDRFGNLLTSALGESAKAAGGVGATLGTSMTSGLSSVLLNPVTGIPAIVLGAVAAAFVGLPVAIITGAAAVAGTLAAAGLGGILLGGIFLKDDPQIKAGLQGLLGEVTATFKDAVQPLKGPFLESIGILRDGFKGLAPGIKDFFKGLAKGGGIQELARGFAGFMKSLSDTGALKSLGEAVGPVLKQLGMALPDIGNSVSQLLISFAKAAGPASRFFGTFLRFFADVIRIGGGALGWLASRWDALRLAASIAWQAAKDVLSGVKILGSAVAGALTANMDKVRPLAELLKRIFGGLVGKITEIPSKITGALGNAKTLLLSAGKNIVQGLIDGIRNKLGALGGIMSTVTNVIGSFFPNSPEAQRGALSGNGAPFHRGQAIALGVAGGMESQMPAVHSAADQLAWSGAGRSSRAAAAAPAEMMLGFRSDGSQLGDALVYLISESMRTRYGGNINALTGGSSSWART